MLPQLYLAGRAFAAAAGLVLVLAFLGYAPARLLCGRALAADRLALAPLLGWTVLAAGTYLLLTWWPFGVAFAGLAAAAGAANAALLGAALRRRGRQGQRPHPQAGSRRRVPASFLRVSGSEPRSCYPGSRPALLDGGKNVEGTPRRPSHGRRLAVLALCTCAVFFVVLSPHLYHGTLALLVPNQDDDFFVGVAGRFWEAPMGWRLAWDPARVETGWAYPLLVATLRLFPLIDDVEAVPIACYAALALAVAPLFLFYARELRLPSTCALFGAGLAPLHGLVLWTPGYGFGPNAAAIAATPFAVLCACRAIRLTDLRSLVLGAAACALLLMSYTKVTVMLFALLWVGLVVVTLLDAGGWRQRAVRRSSRLVALGVGGTALGGFAIYDALAWGLPTAGALLFDRAEEAGAGWGWKEFPSPAAWLGAQPWSLIAGPWPEPIGGVVHIAAAIGAGAAAALAAAGLVSLRGRPYRSVLGVLLGCALFLIYARFVKAFPYAVFKLYTLTAFLAVGLCLRGALYARRLARRARHPWPRLQTALPASGLALYALAFAGATWQSLRFYYQPWEPLRRPDTIEEVATLARAMPAGSTVLVSGLMVVPVAPERAAVRPHPIAFHSLWHAQHFGAARLHSTIEHLFGRAGIIYEGIYERAVGYTVAPPDEAHGFVLLGADEDPRFFGSDRSLRVSGGRLLSLYARAPRATLTAADIVALLRPADAGRRIRLAVSCNRDLDVLDLPDHEAAALTEPAAAEATSAPCGRASVVLGLMAAGAGPVEIRLLTPQDAQGQPLYLQAGLTWYRTPSVHLPAIISVAPLRPAGNGREPVIYVGAATVLPAPGDAPRDLRRSDGAAALFALHLDDGALVLEARFGGAPAPHDLRDFGVFLAAAAIGPGPRYATDVDPGQAFQAWRWRLAPGRTLEQEIDGRRVPMPGAPIWSAVDGRHWLRLQFQRGGNVWLDLPVGYAEATNGRFTAVRQVTALVRIPSPEPSPAPPLPQPGTLVRGMGGQVFLVGNGALRWVPSLQVFERHGFAWEMVEPVDEQLLTAWPVGLPLD